MLTTFKAALAAAVLFFANPVLASSVWLPTDGDINASGLFSTPGVTFGIFDDDNPGLVGGALLEFRGGDIMTFSGTTITNTRTSASASLSGNQAFTVAAFLDGAWVGDTAFVMDTPTAYQISFNTGKTSAHVYLNDVTPVPEPSTLLLMALGVAGLMVMRRRAS